jgi:hypothetical protein
MAIVVIEEVLVGLDEVKASLEQAVTMLTDIVEDIPPDMGQNLQEVLEQILLQPLQSRLATLDTLLDEVASMS